MKLISVQKIPINDNDENNQECPRLGLATVDPNDEDGDIFTNRNNEPENRTSETEEEPLNFIKYYHGREWSEVEHLLRVPAESEKGDDDEDDDWSPEASQISTDSQDDPFAEDIHDLVNVLDNMIRSQSNLSCDAARVVDYLDLDLFKYDTVLSEVQDWTWESDEFLSEESFTSSERDSAPTP